MAFSCLLTWLKGDWAEWATTFGFANWGTKQYPCPLCFATHDDWRDYRRCGFDRLLWADTQQADYEAACQLCELRFVVETVADKALLRRSLRFDERESGFRGRFVTRDIPEFNLEYGDRLEPGGSIWDIGSQFDRLCGEPGPIEVVFWRRKKRDFCPASEPHS